MKRMLRYDARGRKSHQLSIPKTREDLLIQEDRWNYFLAYEVKQWLRDNCSEEYRIIPSRHCTDIHFQSERDATLFWTFHA